LNHLQNLTCPRHPSQVVEAVVCCSCARPARAIRPAAASLQRWLAPAECFPPELLFVSASARGVAHKH
jgi:hypothetical protein